MSLEKSKIEVLSTEESFRIIDKKMESEKRFFFSRFGDVDFMMMKKDNIGKILGRSNKMNVSEKFHEEMIEAFSITDPNYLVSHFSNMKFEPGMDILDLQGNYKAGSHNHTHWHKNLHEMTLDIIRENDIKIDSLKFLNHTTFYMYSVFRRKELGEFISKNIKDKKKMFIGCRKKEDMESLFGNIDSYVETPDINSYESIDRWWPKVERDINNVDIVLPFSGQSGRVANKRLWNMGCEVQSIDMGSWIDPYVGVVNRTWTRHALHYMMKNQ